jgi:hypothetical protein
MRVHWRSPIFRRHDDRFASRLPFGGLLSQFWKLQDVRCGIPKRHERPALGGLVGSSKGLAIQPAQRMTGTREGAILHIWYAL